MAKNYQFNKLAKDYGNFMAPSFKIKAANKDLTKTGIAVSSVSVTNYSGFDAATCDFTVANAYDPKERKMNANWMSSIFVPGNIVEVEMGYIKTQPVFYGFIESVNVSFQSGEAPSLGVHCMDGKGAMMSGAKSETMQFKKASDAVKNVIEKYQSKKFIKDIKIDATEEIKEGLIEQHEESDYDFVVRWAEDLNFKFYIISGTAYFKAMPTDKTPMMELEWGSNLMSFNRQLSLYKQIKKVVVKNTNEKDKKVFKGEATKPSSKIGGKNTPDTFTKLVNENAVKYVIDPAVRSDEEAKDKAQAILDQESMKMISGTAACIGIPELEPGRFIKFSKLGDKFDNVYYISRVTHSVNSSGYTTELEFEANAE